MDFQPPCTPAAKEHRLTPVGLFLVFISYSDVQIDGCVVTFNSGLKVKNWICPWLVRDHLTSNAWPTSLRLTGDDPGTF